MTYDHRASIIGYIESQASKKDSIVAIELRALASSIAAEIDIEAGARGTASPAHHIVKQVASLFDTTLHDILSSSQGHAVLPARYAAMWLVKSLLGWSDASIGAIFNRSDSAVSNGLARANELRATDPRFQLITDNIKNQNLVCEHCLTELIR